ncbi:MAG TPA: cyclic nucleotide-binding domain-containing protein [Ilumatobacteraceae bacterium]|nr:cyclic nucleotide-binding domain-containing protein [Ilumatobacteraceae bacterium]
MSDDETGPLPGRRGLLACVFVHAIAEYSAWIAVLVVAFDRGGSAAAGVAVTVQLAPAALLAPVVAAAGDRFARHRVLAVSFATQALAAGGIAVALSTDSPLAVVYLLALVFTVASLPTPAAVVSLLVHYARTPTQLTRWNIERSSVRAAGSLVGPLATALVLALADPSEVFLGLFMLCAAAALLAGRFLPRDDRLPSTLSMSTVIDDAWRGVAYVSTHAAPRRVVGFLGTAEMLIGALDLLFVAIAFDQLGRDGSTVALITVTFAVGTLLAAVVASRKGGWRLTQHITLGAVLLTLPLLLIAQSSQLLIVLLLAAVLGAGNGFIEIGGQTLLQRSCAETMTSRAYGALESTAMIAASIGAVVTGGLLDGRDPTWVAVVLGLVGAVVLIGGSLRLRNTERSVRSADPTIVSCLRSVSFLESLPQPTLERLAQASQRRSEPAGTSVVVQGEPGEEFFALLAGATNVITDGTVVAHLLAPASFGEVALLHGDVRAATVTTTEPSEFAVIRRDDFLDAIERTASSHRGAFDVAAQYHRPTEQA